MVNYEDGKIYKIVCNTTKLVYIGSTTHKLLSQRLTKHVSNYKCFLNGSDNYMTSYKILENSNYEILLIENCKCSDKNELHARERFYILNNECVNKNIPLRTRKEYLMDNAEYIRERENTYLEKNKEKFKEWRKVYNTKNKEIINEKYRNNENNKIVKKIYVENNKEKINEYKKIWRETNKEKIKETYRNKKMFLDHLKCFNV